MRKLSKKISMLMVLAMLVSLFSGIVSASAAAPSSWSFKSSKYDVAVGEDIKMEKNEYADFDLLRYDAAPEGYTVKWSSSDSDVVWVNAKTGQLRADKFKTADYGDKATISATFTNTKTGKSATRSFVIEVAEKAEYALTVKVGEAVLGAETLVADKEYALTSTVTLDGEAVEATVAYTVDGAAVTALKLAEGVYTVVATATVDGKVVATKTYEVVVEATAPEFVSAEQTALKTVEITFNDAAWAKKVVDDNALIQLSYFADEVEISDYIKSVAAKKDADDTVVVSLYNDMAKDTTYKFAYAGYDCVATVVGVDAVPAKIEVVGGNVGAGLDGDLKIKVYTAGGIDITDKGFDDVTYSISESSECDVNGNKIFFFEAGKSVVVTAKLDLGYDEEGNELDDLEAKGVYRSVEPYTFSNLQKFAISTKTGDDVKGLTYGTTVSKMSTDDATAAYYLYASYTRTKADGSTSTQYVAQGAAQWDTENSDETYSYYSSNESVLFIDEATGLLDPVNNGTASVFIKNSDKKVVGSVLVTVEGARKLTTFTASIADKMLSVDDTNAVGDKIEIAVSAKDQLGADAAGVTYTVEVVKPDDIEIDDIFDVTATNGVATVTVANGKITLDPVVGAHLLVDEQGDTETIRIKLTAQKGNDKKSPELQFTMKYVDVDGKSTDTLTLSKSSVDMKLNQKKSSDYNAEITIASKDSKGYDLGKKNFTVMDAKSLDDAAKAAAVTDSYYILVLDKDDKVVAASANKFKVEANKITFKPVYAEDEGIENDGNDEGDVIKKMDKANYSIKLYKWTGSKLQYVTTKTLSLTDSTSGITAKVKATTLEEGYTSADLKDAIEFYRDGKKINDKITTVTVANSIPTTDGAKEYIKKLTLTINNSELKSEFKGTHTEEITLNQLFTID